MKSVLKLGGALLIGSALLACSSSDEEEIKIAELPEIEARFEPTVVWSESVGNGVEDYFSRLQPAVGEKNIYVASRQGELEAFDKTTGDTVWSTHVNKDTQGFWGALWSDDKPARVSGGILLADNKLFLGTEHGELFAFSAESGDMLWHVEVPGEVVSKPAYELGKLVVNTAAGKLLGFDANTGEELWRAEYELPALTLRGNSRPAIRDGGVVIGLPNGETSVYLVDQGRQAWIQEVAEAKGKTDLERLVDIDVEPLFIGSNLYVVSYGGTLAAQELRTGRVVWKRDYAGFRNLSSRGLNLYLTDNNSHVYSLDSRNGLERWSQLNLFNRRLTAPVAYKNYVVVGDFEGYLHFLDRETGELVSRMEVDSDGLYVAPVVEGDYLYLQSRSGEVLAISAP